MRVFGGWCPHLCVLEGSGSVCHCLSLFQSYQLFLCVWVSVLQGYGSV